MAVLVGAKMVTGRFGLGSWSWKPLRLSALDRKNRSGCAASTPAMGVKVPSTSDAETLQETQMGGAREGYKSKSSCFTMRLSRLNLEGTMPARLEQDWSGLAASCNKR